ncbi:MAG: diguanylate cyclase [Polyangiales bacterium]
MRAREITTRSLLCCVLWIATAAGLPTSLRAEPLPMTTTWVEPPAGMAADRWDRPLDVTLPSLSGPRRTGGRFWHEATLVVPKAGVHVIDFAHSTTIGRFRHIVFDAHGTRIADSSGGIESAVPNLFMLRHGRPLQLDAGVYHLRSELRSPFFLGEPTPYVEELHAYTASIKAGAAVTLLSLGVLLGLGFCYAVLARPRRRRADTLYVLVIAGNVLYSGTALLALPDLLGLRWIHLMSVSLLVSNVAYIVFVTSLLELHPLTHPRLFRAATLLLAGFVLLLAAGAVWPHASLDLGRIGVSLLTPCAFVAAVIRAREGYAPARLYLVALSAFYALGGLALLLSARLAGLGLYIEHLGLLASAVEASLLALVLAHQFSVLHAQRESAEHRAREGQRIAHSDPLTGLPNRSALDASIATLPPHGSLTFIDLDGLKHYNDKYGHQRGDELICSFATDLNARLEGDASLFRLGGDEFAITCPAGDADLVNERIEETVGALRSARFKMTGASAGTVHVHEQATTSDLKHLADTRMYEEKRRRRSGVSSDWLRDDPPRNTSRPPPPQSGPAPCADASEPPLPIARPR